MTPISPYRAPGGRLALGVFLAIVLGAAAPLLTVLEVSLLMPVIVLSGVFMVFLDGYAGRPPAWLFMTVQLCAAMFLLNGTFAAMLLIMGTAPAMLTMRLLLERRPFFEAMRQSLLFYTLGLLAGLTVAWLTFGGGMIGRVFDALMAQLEQLPDSFFQPVVQTVNTALGGAKTLTVADYREQLPGILTLARQTYEQALPGMLITGAALSGVLSVLWGSWLLARRGMATEESYVPLTRWFLPGQVSGGLMLVWLAAFILLQSGYGSGQAVHTAALDLATLAFSIQALAAIDRFFFRRGMPDRARRGWVIAGTLLGLALPPVGDFLFIIGLGSAMFGSHGLFKSRFNRGNGDDQH